MHDAGHRRGRRGAVRRVLAGRPGRDAARGIRRLERRRPRDLRRARPATSSCPSGLAGMAVRNTDDFIPALAGPQLDHHLLQVERRAFDAGQPDPDRQPAPAHQRERLRRHRDRVDARDLRRGARADRRAWTPSPRTTPSATGSTVTVMTYHAERGATTVSRAYWSSGSSRRFDPVNGPQDDADQPGDDAEHAAPRARPSRSSRRCRPNPIRPLIHATSSSSRPLTTNEMRPSVRM